jgi:integrase
VPLPGEPGSVEFMAAYQAALAAFEGAHTDIGARRTQPGTVAAAVACYFGSRLYADLAPETKRSRRAILEKFRERFGNGILATLTRRRVEAILDAIGTPHGRKNLMAALRAVFAACIPAGLIDADPTAGIRTKVPASDGYRTWSKADIAQYEAHHPIGTKERLAFALLLHTGQRRGDVVRMGRQHITSDGHIMVRQQKTGTTLPIPLHPALQEILAATPTTNLTFLTTDKGHPFAGNNFSAWFRKRCADAGLPPGLSAHGLRKACLTHLAEAGCTAHQIAAISGHKTLRETQRYCAAADQKRLAEDAMRKQLESEQSERKIRKPKSSVSQTLSQLVESKGREKERNGK